MVLEGVIKKVKRVFFSGAVFWIVFLINILDGVVVALDYLFVENEVKC
jgi:hypothetical protein